MPGAGELRGSQAPRRAVCGTRGSLRTMHVMVSGEQQGTQPHIYRIHMHVSILPPAPLPPSLPHNLKQRSMCERAGHSSLTHSEDTRRPFPGSGMGPAQRDSAAQTGLIRDGKLELIRTLFMSQLCRDPAVGVPNGEEA